MSEFLPLTPAIKEAMTRCAASIGMPAGRLLRLGFAKLARIPWSSSTSCVAISPRPTKEQAWNAWYSGPKIEQMLAKPHFRTCQRFRLAVGQRPQLSSAVDAAVTRGIPDPGVHVSDWGFFEWASLCHRLEP